MLHLLIVGVGVRDKQEQGRLVKQALQALQTNSGDEGLRSSVFKRVIMHPYSDKRKVQLVADYVHQGDVTSALDKMRHFIEHNGSPSDVALIYWLGRDLVIRPDAITLIVRGWTTAASCSGLDGFVAQLVAVGVAADVKHLKLNCKRVLDPVAVLADVGEGR